MTFVDFFKFVIVIGLVLDSVDFAYGRRQLQQRLRLLQYRDDSQQQQTVSPTPGCYYKNLQKFDCDPDICTLHPCAANSAATCVPVYCSGNCGVEYYFEGKKVDCQNTNAIPEKINTNTRGDNNNNNINNNGVGNDVDEEEEEVDDNWLQWIGSWFDRRLFGSRNNNNNKAGYQPLWKQKNNQGKNRPPDDYDALGDAVRRSFK